MNLSIIAAIGQNNELGKNNNLIWRLKDDMKFFKDTTIGHTIIMGRKTFTSLPSLLTQRKHLVLTRSNLTFPKDVTVYNDLQDFLNDYQDSEEEIFDIGGETLYRELLDYAGKLYLTEIEAYDKDADAYFPTFDKDDFDRSIIGTHYDEKENIKYKHVLYKRRNYGKR